MKQILYILILFQSFNVICQVKDEPRLVNFMAVCDQNWSIENHFRINPRIIARAFINDVYSLQIDIYGNCAMEDTSFLWYSGDTLHLLIAPADIIVGDTYYAMGADDCNCFMHLFYDILHLAEEPKVILINNKRIVESTAKYRPEEYFTKDGREYIRYDSNGVYYDYIFYESGSVKRIRKESGSIAQLLFFSESGELQEIVKY